MNSNSSIRGTTAARPETASVMSAGIPIKDPSGKTLFYLDARTSSSPRDLNGKPVGSATDDGDISLTRAAVALMDGRDVRRRDGDGRLVLMDLGAGDVVTPTAARAAFTGAEGDFIANDICPVKLVEHDRGLFWTESPLDSIQQSTTGGAAGAAVQTSDITLTRQQFLTGQYGFGSRVPIQTARNADFDLKVTALRRAVLASRLAREIRVATLLTTASNWATGSVVPVIAAWNSVGATVSPLADLFAGRAVSFLPPTSFVISEAAESFFYANGNSTRVRDFVQSGGVLPKVLVGRARQMSGGVPSFVWPRASAVLLRDPTDPATSIGSARTLRWAGPDTPDSVQSEGILVRTFEHEGFLHVVVVHNDLEVMVQSPSVIGSLLTGVMT